jgi:hypothetical protein
VVTIRGRGLPEARLTGSQGSATFPEAIAASTAPRNASPSDSVPPLVKTISRGAQPSAAAHCSRAASSAARAAWPGPCTLDGLAKLSRNSGSIAASTSGCSGVVALASR